RPARRGLQLHGPGNEHVGSRPRVRHRHLYPRHGAIGRPADRCLTDDDVNRRPDDHEHHVPSHPGRGARLHRPGVHDGGRAPAAGTPNTCEPTSGASPVPPPAPYAGGAGYDLTGKPDGTYTFSVFSTDQAGNVGDPATSSYVLDTQPPSPATITAQPASPGNG